MDTSEFTDFSTFTSDGVVVSDTFNAWRKKTNGIVNAVNTNTLLPNGGITPAKLSAGKPSWDASGNLTVTGTIGGTAITGTSLSAGTGTITTSNTVYANALAIGTSNDKFVVSSSGSLITANSITATSLNASGGQISGGAIIGTSLNVSSGTIAGGAFTGTTLTLSGGTGDILTNGSVKSNTLGIGTSNDKFTVSNTGVVTANGNITAPTFIGNLTGTASAIADSTVSPPKLTAGGPTWTANSTTLGGTLPSGDYALNIGNLARISNGTCAIIMGSWSGGGAGTTLFREAGLNTNFKIIQNGTGQIEFSAQGGLKIKDAPIPNPDGTAPIYGARAYGYFTFGGSPVTTRTLSSANSKNISSVTKGTSSSTTVSFTTPLPANYVVIASRVGTGGTLTVSTQNGGTNSFTVFHSTEAATAYAITFVVFG